MTIGILQIQGAPIQVDSHVYQADIGIHSSLAASETKGKPDFGGRLQFLDPAHGIVNYTMITTLFIETTAVETTAFLLVASGIKT